MLYDYVPVLNFNPEKIRDIVKYFSDFERYFISSMKLIEEKHSKLQEDFDVSHPNITLMVTKYLFNKETNTIESYGDITLNVNGFLAHASEIDDERYSADKNTVVCLSNINKGTRYLSEFFLSRDYVNHKVYWLYNTSSEYIPDELAGYDSDDVVPYTVLSANFFKKRLEHFPELYSTSLSADSTDIFTKSIGETYFNNLSNVHIYCLSNNISGDSLQIFQNTCSFTNDISLTTDALNFKDGYVFSRRSPVSTKYGEKEFALKTLENVNVFNVLSKNIENRYDDEIIDKDNFLHVSDLLYDKTVQYIDDAFKVEVSRGRDASTFKSLLQIITSFLNDFYTEKIKLFLSNYINFGALSELVKYIEEKINEFKGKYIENTECDIPLNNIDEGCKIDCDQIHLEESHLMVTKQKLKSIVRCALMCDTMPYSEEELSSAIVYNGPKKFDSSSIVSAPSI